MMTMTYYIKIYDTQGNIIGELPAATPIEISKYLSKGFIVKDGNTGNQITLESIGSVVGVSDGFIDIG